MLLTLLRKLALFGVAVLLLGVSVTPGWGQTSEIPPPAEPEVISVFPPGAAPGAKIQVQIRGRTLDGAYAIWSEDESLDARVTKIEEIQPKSDGEAGNAEDPGSASVQQAIAWIEVNPTAQLGAHRFRLVSLRGVSNPLTFQVLSTPIVVDASFAHNTPDKAQPVNPSVAINGEIDKAGAMNYYVFEARKDEEIKFELEGSGDLLDLYERDGSWFDADRIDKLEPEKSLASGIYRFSKSDKYLAQVKGEPDSKYQLRMIAVKRPASASASSDLQSAISANSGWREREFTRELGQDRLKVLWSRTLATPALDMQASAGNSIPAEAGPGEAINKPIAVVSEHEPNEKTLQAEEISIPCILEGTIGRPGDVDNFKFEVKPGERLAFEIQTPDVASPYFNPLIRILNAQGQQVMTNVYKRIPVQSMEFWDTVEPKTIYTFQTGGEYFFQVRDVTLQHGEPGFRYRILVRSQVPHVGEVDVVEVVQHAANDSDILNDRVNLVPGYSKKLTVTTAREEDFSGEIAIILDNLPPGVEALAGSEMEDEQAAPHDEGLKQNFRPKTEQTTILLVANDDAPLTKIPQIVRVSVRPIVPGRVTRWYKTGLSDSVVRKVTEGKVGAPLPVQSFPLMVVRPSESASAANRIAATSRQPIPESQVGSR